ncbi:MAG: arsenate reductase family protein [Candidatus Latescibacterota bacterium]|jgi:arsenate reductase|tara:strand:+ start:354 stop:707 length:354 start_codon:yes stop_codon:yes gene_type:complete
MAYTLYHYPKCSTCRKAIKFLDERDIPYKKVDIVESPPSAAELKRMLAHLHGQTKRLFNTSGELYREMGLKDKVAAMKDSEAIALLAQHGKLIKRPFLLGKDGGTVGFKEEVWKALV